jgi:phosphoglycolate phosphatase-like HAD superfamily hydrolase
MPTRLENLKAIVFDFDGVILESADIKTDAFLAVFAAHPEKRQEILDYHLSHVGISRYVKFEYITEKILGLPYDETERVRLGDEFSRQALEKILAYREIPGARTLLPQLKGKVVRAVASGTPEEELRQIVAARKMENWFEEVWGTPRTKPEILRDLMARHGFSANHVLMVGDGLTDYKAAQDTGVRFLAREPGRVFTGMVVDCVKDLTEMQTWLGENAM